MDFFYRRHEGDHFSGWLCQNRYDSFSIQKDFPIFEDSKPYTFMHYRSKVNIASLGTQYLAYTSG